MPKKNEQPQRYVSRRQLSHRQRESRIQRIALLGGLIVVVAVLALSGLGLYNNQLKPLREVILKVNNTDFTEEYYINSLAYYGQQQGGPQSIPNIADQVLQQIEQNKVIMDATAKLDPPVTVSDAEVNATLTQRKLSSDATRVDAIRMELLLPKIRDYYDKTVPASAEQRAVLAMFLESQTQANDVIARINKGETFQFLSGNLSLEGNSKSKNGDFGFVPKGILPATLGQAFEDQVFSENTTANTFYTFADPSRDKTIGYWLVKVTENRTTDAGVPQAHVSVMLLGSQEQAVNIKQQLDAGADWAELAKANSQYGDTAKDGGDQGFKAKGEMPTAVDNVIFGDQSLPLNVVSAPVPDTSQPTTGGVWLYEVTAIDPNKTIDGTNRTSLVNDALNTWATQAWTAAQSGIQNLITPAQKQYAITKAQSR